MDLLSNPFVYRGSKIYVSTTEAGESPNSESVESELMRLQFITKTLPRKAVFARGCARAACRWVCESRKSHCPLGLGTFFQEQKDRGTHQLDGHSHMPAHQIHAPDH